jgi:hypothetical protein
MSYSDFLSKKIDVALKVAAGGCGGGYTEAAIVLAALSSGISADVWPGESIDRKRFVELWAKRADSQLEPLKISVPLLTQDLRVKGDCAAAESIEGARPDMFGLGYSTRILVGSEVDMSESEVLGLAPDLKVSFLRGYSYAALFYRHVRCGLMHEFHVSEEATWNPMTTRDAPVSYSNRGSGLGSEPYVIRRLIHFKISWLADVIRSIALHYGDSGPLVESIPAKWWIEA